MVLVASVELAEEGAHEVPIEGVAQPGMVVMLPIEAAMPMVDAPWPGVTAPPQEKNGADSVTVCADGSGDVGDGGDAA
jgi:hypothetical protein